MIVNKKEEIEMLKEIQKGAEMGIKAIETITPKVYDDDLALQLSRQSLKYASIRAEAMDRLLEEKALPKQGNAMQEAMLVGGIHMNTIMDTSSSHIAELMIQGSNRGITNMWKSMNQYPAAKGRSLEIANEFVDFEERNIEILKKYL